jgi:hypothetical protein
MMIGGEGRGLVFVGGKTVAIAGSASNNTVSLTDLTGGIDSAPSEGDFIIVAHTIAATVDASMSVITGGYTEQVELMHDDSDSDKIANFCVSTKFAGSTPDTSVEVSAAGSTQYEVGVSVHVWRYVDPDSPLDVAIQTATADSRNPTPPSITPVTNGAVIVCAGGANSGSSAIYAMPSDLGNFTTARRDGSWTDVMAGIGSAEWVSGAFTPEAWTSSGGSANSACCSVSMALRPRFPNY